MNDLVPFIGWFLVSLTLFFMVINLAVKRKTAAGKIYRNVSTVVFALVVMAAIVGLVFLA